MRSTDVPTAVRELRCTPVGAALLLHLDQEVGAAARRLVHGVAVDPDHTVVVVDLPPEALPPHGTATAGLLAARPGGFRLIFARSGPAGASTAAAQWLADRLGRAVITHDGAVVPVGNDGLFVPVERGRSGWVRFTPGAAPVPESHRFPRPSWDPLPVNHIARAGRSIVEPLPGGIWIRQVHDVPIDAGHRRTLVEAMYVQDEVLAVVLGAPGDRPLDLHDVAGVWRALDPRTRAATRFVEYGPVEVPRGTPVGAALAALVDEPVTFYTGLPVAPPAAGSGRPRPRAVRADGSPGHHPFAAALGYDPVGGAPHLADHRRPVPDSVPEIAPGHYELAYDAVLEVVAAGLWVRPSQVPPGADAVRSAPADPERIEVVYEARTPEMARRLRRVADEAVELLEPEARAVAVVRAGETAVAERAPVAPPRDAADPIDLPAEVPAPPAGFRTETAAPEVVTAPGTPAAGVVAPGAAAGLVVPGVVVPGAVVPGAVEGGGRPASGPSVAGPAVAGPAPAVGRPVAAGPAVAGPPVAGPPVPQPLAPPAESPTAAPSPDRTASTDRSVRTTTAPPAAVAAPLAALSALPRPPASAPSSAAPSSPAPSSAAPSSPAPSSAAPSSVAPAAPASAAPAVPLPAVSPPVPDRVAPTAPAWHAPAPGAFLQPPTGQPPAVPAAVEPAPVPASPVAAGPIGAVAPAGPLVVQARLQTIPGPRASLVPPPDGLDAERTWLRRHFQTDYDADAGVVAAVLSQTPGLRTGFDREQVVLDLVAVRLYLRGDSLALSSAAHAGRPGPHVPLGRCVAAGLGRLPSYRGAARIVVPGAAAAAALYRAHQTLTEWSVLEAWLDPGPAQPGDLDVRIWSGSARRTALLEPDVAGRVVFTPGTAFRVLSVTDGDTPVVTLRESTGAAEPAGRSPFDDLAEAGLARAAENRRTDPDVPPRTGSAPGLRWVEVPR